MLLKETSKTFKSPFIKIISLVGVLIALPVFCFGQTDTENLDKEIDSGSEKTGKVKVVRTFTSEAGLKKMRPFHLTKELYFDELDRVQKEVDYTYRESVFGTDSVITTQEYTYAQGSKAVVFLKKTFLTIEKKEHHKNIIGYEFGQDGTVSKMLAYQPDGTVKEAANPLGLVASDQNGLVEGGLAQRTQTIKVPQPVYTGKDSQSSPTQTHYAAGTNYGNLLSPQTEHDEIITTREAIANGYVVREVTKSGKVLSEQRVLLNDKRLVSHIVTSESEFKGKLKTVSIQNYIYDNSGNEISRELLGPDGKLILKYAHTYNALGKLEKSVVSEKKGKVKKIMKFEYEFQ